ncbi:MAG: hypothetical protein QM747_13600 [Nocardioides sp.]
MKSSSLQSTGHAHARAPFRPFAVTTAFVLALCAAVAHAATWTLDDAASPISAVFNDATGRLSVTVKSTGTVWGQGTAGGGSSYSLNGTVTQPDTKNLTVPALLNTYAVTLALQLRAGDRRVEGHDQRQLDEHPEQDRLPVSVLQIGRLGFRRVALQSRLRRADDGHDVVATVVAQPHGMGRRHRQRLERRLDGDRRSRR